MMQWQVLQNYRNIKRLRNNNNGGRKHQQQARIPFVLIALSAFLGCDISALIFSYYGF
jgi:hypothetical protein